MDPTALTSESYGFGIDVVLWNILYNLGYMYTDIKGFIDTGNSNSGKWSDFGSYLGDFLMRFFYSRYVPRSATS